jgi:hypothetical protein
MMPTFPRPSLSFRTAGFPRYGWKLACRAAPSLADGDVETPQRHPEQEALGIMIDPVTTMQKRDFKWPERNGARLVKPQLLDEQLFEEADKRGLTLRVLG